MKLNYSRFFGTIAILGVLLSVIFMPSFRAIAEEGVKIGGNGYSCVTADNRWKIEEGNFADLPDGYEIESVVVKAGNENSTDTPCVPVFPTNSAPTCYSVAITGNQVTVTKIGSGRTCKDISHLEGTYVISEDEDPILGCTDDSALNYNPEATQDDQSCEYPEEEILGCTDPEATNYDPEATQDDESCEYDPGDPTPTPTVTPTITPTPSPEVPHPQPQNGIGGASESTPNNTSPSTGSVLGASTMAATGVATDSLYNLFGALGSSLMALSFLKKRK